MFRRSVDLVTAFCLFNAVVLGVFEEPVCSKFHFEEKVLEKLIKMEVRVDSELKRIDEANNDLREKLSKAELRLDDKLNELAEADSGLKDKLTGQATQTEALQAELADLKVDVSKDLQGPDTRNSDPVFFVAHAPSRSLSQFKPIKYKTVVANHGGGYDTGTGKFTAPSGGVYIFSAQICAGNHVRYQILVNDIPYSSSYQYDHGQDGVCSSVSKTALLAKDDQVWVKILNGGVEVINVDGSYKLWNMFTGTLVNH